MRVLWPNLVVPNVSWTASRPPGAAQGRSQTNARMSGPRRGLTVGHMCYGFPTMPRPLHHTRPGVGPAMAVSTLRRAARIGALALACVAT